MLITVETDYALRILRALFQAEGMTVGALSQQELLPEKYAYKIVKKLERAGMVQIVRGAGGGCRLDVDLHTVSLYDLARAMDDKTGISSCMNESYCCKWRQSHQGNCNVHTHLAQIQEKIDQELKKRTIYWVLFGK